MKKGDIKQNISILDCTLRDGSYMIDYQFTAEDTYIICLGLQLAGFKWIEIGHGTGFHSSEAGLGKAAATDENYLEAAKSALEDSTAQFGMFFIPGIGRMQDLELGARYGMGFVRIGVNVTDFKEAEPYIKKAKSLGLKVSTNLMKSYAVSIEEFVRIARQVDQFGSDVIAIIDSAGGMFPADVKEYVTRLKDITQKTIGFHGHNNLQMAVANTLEAVKAGAGIVDSSLQGIGRSAGNTQTEILVMVLEKLGYETGIDAYRTLDLGERVIKSMVNKTQGVDDISIVSGIAQFHSSFYKHVRAAAEKYKIDPRVLIVEISRVERVHLTPELIDGVALKIKEKTKQKERSRRSMPFIPRIVEEEFSVESGGRVRRMVEQMVALSSKTGKESVFSMTLSRHNQTAFPSLRQSPSFVIGNVEALDCVQLEQFITIVDGKVDWILLDGSLLELRESGLERKIQSSHFTWYSEERALRLSVSALVAQNHPHGNVLVLYDKESLDLFRIALGQQGIKVYSIGGEDIEKVLQKTTAIVSFGREYARSLTSEYIPYLPEGMTIYAARPGAFEPSFWKAVLERGVFVCRVDERVGLMVEITLCIETKRMISLMGVKEAFDTLLVSGGVIGMKGSVVVDSVNTPTRLIGIADGEGGVLSSEEEKEFRETKNKVLGELVKSLYQKTI